MSIQVYDYDPLSLALLRERVTKLSNSSDASTMYRYTCGTKSSESDCLV